MASDASGASRDRPNEASSVPSCDLGSERPPHPLVMIGNCVPLEDSLAGEPDCVTIRFPREKGDEVGVCAVRDVGREVCFGPLLEEEKDEGTSSLWMRSIKNTTCEATGNVVRFHHDGALYYKTCKEVRCDEELVLLVESSPQTRDAASDVADNSPGRHLVSEHQHPMTASTGDYPKRARDGIPRSKASENLTPNEKGRNRGLKASSARTKRRQMQKGEQKDNMSVNSRNAFRGSDMRRLRQIDRSDDNVSLGTKMRRQSSRNKTKPRPASKSTPLMIDEKSQRRIQASAGQECDDPGITVDRRWSCSFCKRSFTTKGQAKIHERIHTGERPFSCSFCKKGFTQIVNLKSHERIHTGERPFSCSFCIKGFTHRFALKRHERIHTGERPFSCSFCNKRFTDRSNLNTHVRIHSGERPFSCSFCIKSFTDRSSMRKHERTHDI